MIAQILIDAYKGAGNILREFWKLLMYPVRVKTSSRNTAKKLRTILRRAISKDGIMERMAYDLEKQEQVLNQLWELSGRKDQPWEIPEDVYQSILDMRMKLLLKLPQDRKGICVNGAN